MNDRINEKMKKRLAQAGLFSFGTLTAGMA
jgi:hypothetical protein